MHNSNSTENKWTVTVEEDPETGELLLPFPPDLLSQMGWAEGTDIWWEIDEKGNVILTDKPTESSEEEKSSRT